MILLWRWFSLSLLFIAYNRLVWTVGVDSFISRFFTSLRSNETHIIIACAAVGGVMLILPSLVYLGKVATADWTEDRKTAGYKILAAIVAAVCFPVAAPRTFPFNLLLPFTGITLMLYLTVAWSRLGRNAGDILLNQKHAHSTSGLDLPVDAPAADYLGRAKQASEVANYIHGAHAQASMRLAICGEWGSGKTSFLKLILHFLNSQQSRDCKNEYAVAWFNPWQFGGHDEAWSGFVDCIETALVEAGNTDLTELRSLMRIWKRTSQMSKVADVGGLFKRLIDLPDGLDIALTKKNLARHLRTALGAKRRLIIFVDDLDRSRPDVIERLLMFIKEIGDIQNITYVLAISEDSVANLLSQHYGKAVNGREFLDKIVDLRIILPPISREYKLMYLRKQISPFDVASSINDLTSIVDFLPDNPRKLKKLISFADAQNSFLKRFGSEEIDWPKMFLSYVLKLELSEELNWVMSQAGLLEALSKSRNWGDSVPKEREAAKLAAIESIKSKFPDTAIRFVDILEQLSTSSLSVAKIRAYLTDFAAQIQLTNSENKHLLAISTKSGSGVEEVGAWLLKHFDESFWWDLYIQHLGWFREYFNILNLNLPAVETTEERTELVNNLIQAVRYFEKLVTNRSFVEQLELRAEPSILSLIIRPLTDFAGSNLSADEKLVRLEESKSLDAIIHSTLPVASILIRGFGANKVNDRRGSPAIQERLDRVRNRYETVVMDKLSTSLTTPGSIKNIYGLDSRSNWEAYLLLGSNSEFFSRSLENQMIATLKDNAKARNPVVSTNARDLIYLAIESVRHSFADISIPIATEAFVKHASFWAQVISLYTSADSVDRSMMGYLIEALAELEQRNSPAAPVIRKSLPVAWFIKSESST